MRTVMIDGIPKTWHEAHQDMWNELSQNPGMTKEDYFYIHKLSGGDFINDGFACECCLASCEKCPIIKWREEQTHNCTPLTSPCSRWTDEEGKEHIGLYEEWWNCIVAEMYIEACKIAKQIADLEWIEPDEPEQ